MLKRVLMPIRNTLSSSQISKAKRMLVIGITIWDQSSLKNLNQPE